MFLNSPRTEQWKWGLSASFSSGQLPVGGLLVTHSQYLPGTSFSPDLILGCGNKRTLDGKVMLRPESSALKDLKILRKEFQGAHRDLCPEWGKLKFIHLQQICRQYFNSGLSQRRIDSPTLRDFYYSLLGYPLSFDCPNGQLNLFSSVP